MHRKTYAAILITFLLFNMLTAQLKEEDSRNQISAETIIDSYKKACGGALLEEIKTEIRKGTLLRGVSGKVPFTVTTKAPGKWNYNQVFAWGDQVSYGSDGKNGWIQDTQSIKEMSHHQIQDMNLLFDLQAPLKMHELFPGMKIRDTENTLKRDTVTLISLSGEKAVTELDFDLKSGLLIRAGDIIFEDYRETGKVKRPYRIILGSDDGKSHKKIIMQISEIQQNIIVNDSLFQKPRHELRLKEPPLYKHRKEVEVSIEAMDECVGVYQHPEVEDVCYTVTRQKNHLMLSRTGGGKQKIEIKPQSETKYFIRFLGLEFHFIKDNSGKVTHLEIDANEKIRLRKIE